jgi:hypothetical protein
VLTLEELWDRLRQVRSLVFVAHSPNPRGWNGQGVGTVEVREASDGRLTFHEQGDWRPEAGGGAVRFRNVYRWTRVGALLRLEHLRFGEGHPVYLFDLEPAGEQEWRSVSPHLCREDCYAAVLLVRDGGLGLRWSIDGPGKQEVIEHLYAANDAPWPQEPSCDRPG